MVSKKPKIRVGSKIFDLEVPGVDDFGAETIFNTKIAVHYKCRTTKSDVVPYTYTFYALMAGDWVYIDKPRLKNLFSHTELGVLFTKFENYLHSLRSNTIFVGREMKNIMRGPYETGIRYTGD